MAILINKEINYKGLTVSSIYIRLKFTMNYNGDIITVDINPYISKEIFRENETYNISEFLSIPSKITLNYNRTDETVDILTFIHNEVINYLTTEQTIDVEYTPNTDETFNTNYITTKFCEKSDLYIVDID